MKKRCSPKLVRLIYFGFCFLLLVNGLFGYYRLHSHGWLKGCPKTASKEVDVWEEYIETNSLCNRIRRSANSSLRWGLVYLLIFWLITHILRPGGRLISLFFNPQSNLLIWLTLTVVFLLAPWLLVSYFPELVSVSLTCLARASPIFAGLSLYYLATNLGSKNLWLVGAICSSVLAISWVLLLEAVSLYTTYFWFY